MQGFPISVEVPVAWGDMDVFAHVNNTIYFRWFESARIAYLDHIGFRGHDSPIGPILASTHCRFRRKVVYPDIVQIGARVTEVSGDRFTMEYRIISKQSGEIAADGGGVVVAYDYSAATKVPIPAAVRAAILKDLTD